MKTYNNCIRFLLILILSGCSSHEKRPLHMFRGDLFHSGIYESAAITEKPVINWEFKTNGILYASPVIAGNKVFVGDEEGTLYAIDKISGELLWEFQAGGGIASTPAVYRGNVFFISRDGKFYAVNGTEGKLVWTFQTAGEDYFSAQGIHGLKPSDSLMVDDWDFYLSSPSISGERIYFGVGSGYVYSLNAGTGEKMWEYKTGNVVHSSPAIAYGNVYIGSWDSYFYALDQSTGELSWKYKTGIDTVTYNQVGIQGSPVISDSTVFFGCRDAHIYSLDAITGDLKWKFFNDYSWVIVTPICYQDQLIFATSDSQKFRALNRKDGTLDYELSLSGFIFSSPVIAGHYCYFGSFNGSVYGIDLEKKVIAWNYMTPEAINDPLEILNNDQSIKFEKIFKEATKQGMEDALEYLKSIGPVLSTPALDNGILYFGTENGSLYAIK
jgi:outer membrane protein assembly factor BamB